MYILEDSNQVLFIGFLQRKKKIPLLKPKEKKLFTNVFLIRIFSHEPHHMLYIELKILAQSHQPVHIESNKWLIHKSQL